MKNILAFGASSSKNSINKQFATYAVHQLDNVNPTILDLNDFEMPIYSIDKEQENGIPELAHQFKNHIKSADGIIVSFAEHNGSYSAAFKNIFDWISRIEGKVWEDKPMLLLSTSPGGRGGKTVLDTATISFPFMGSKSVNSFALPSFQQNFSDSGITDNELNSNFKEQLSAFQLVI